jgi:hypothetical protein
MLKQAFQFYAAAQSRTQRRKSLWNLVLRPLGLVGWLSAWYLAFRWVWSFQLSLFPSHQFRSFWPSGVSFPAFALRFVMLIAPGLGSITFGLLVANCIAWLIPPARSVLDEGAAACPGTSFRGSTVGLIKRALFMFPACFLVAMFAASMLNSLR